MGKIAGQPIGQIDCRAGQATQGWKETLSMQGSDGSMLGFEKGDRSLLVNLGGRKAKVDVIAASVFNPFQLREIRQFQCPSAL